MGVAVHEFGHSLGLAHSSVEGSIMFPWYSSNPLTRDLPEDDRTGIQEIYGRVDERKFVNNPFWSKPPTQTTTAKPSTTTRRYYPVVHHPNHYPHPSRHPNSNHPHDRRPYDENRPHERPNGEPTTKRPYYNHPTKRYHVTTAAARHYPGTEVSHKRMHTTSAPKVNACDIEYDAISIIRGDMFIFKDQVSPG